MTEEQFDALDKWIRAAGNYYVQHPIRFELYQERRENARLLLVDASTNPQQEEER